MKANNSLKKIQSRQFLSKKNIKMMQLLNSIDSQKHNLQFRKSEGCKDTDSLVLLVSQNQKIVGGNQIDQKYIVGRMKKLSISSNSPPKNKNHAFLTGVQLQQEKQQKADIAPEMLDDEVKKMLSRKSINDDVDMLRREIKLTNHNLKSYQRQLMKTKKQVAHLAGRYNQYLNLKIPINSPSIDFSTYSFGNLRNFKKSLEKISE